MSISHRKVQSVGKVLVPRGKTLTAKIKATLKTCSDLVGSTLGPGGMSVIIERQESGLAPVVTKDGVTVFKALGFNDPVQQVFLETAREASIKTAQEAGDGTTTATILAEALSSNIQNVVDANPLLSPQYIVRVAEQLFKRDIEPMLKAAKLDCSLVRSKDDDKLWKRCWDVARISANGDIDLANAVMECYDIVGDAGNVTITEASGKTEYEVKKIEGYPIPVGYEESCGVYWPEFINDKATQQCVLTKPLWVLYNGTIKDFNDIFMLANSVAEAASEGKCSPAMVVVANGFADMFLATCAASFATKGAVRIYPLLAPRDRSKTAQLDFLHDIAALTGAEVFDPLTKPLDRFERLEQFSWPKCPESFEVGRFRATILGKADNDLILDRVDQLEQQLDKQSSGEYDRLQLQERIAKLTSGIARLYVRGPSNGEVKERRDRAEDAVCAVRAALKHGAVRGGGHTWITLARNLREKSKTDYLDLDRIIATKIFAPAFESVVARLFTNAGFTDVSAKAMIETMLPEVFDLQSQERVNPLEVGLLDSYPAAYDALRNALSVAGRLGTCGGAIAFERDAELERSEARSAIEYNTNSQAQE